MSFRTSYRILHIWKNQSLCYSMKLQKPPSLLPMAINPLQQYYSTKTSPSDEMTETLRGKFPLAKQIEVVDVSGGCGSMYEIYVESVEFKGLSMVKQHRLINEVLKDFIKEMHGLRIQTKVPDEVG